MTFGILWIFLAGVTELESHCMHTLCVHVLCINRLSPPPTPLYPTRAPPPTCTETCPKCSHSRAYFMQMQTRSADEPMTIFYKCCSPTCGHRWKEWLPLMQPLTSMNLTLYQFLYVTNQSLYVCLVDVCIMWSLLTAFIGWLCIGY